MLGSRREGEALEDGARLYVTGQFSNSLTPPELREILLSDITALGVDADVIYARTWKYFPQYNAAAVGEGLFSALKEAQGGRRTWFTRATFSRLVSSVVERSRLSVQDMVAVGVRADLAAPHPNPTSPQGEGALSGLPNRRIVFPPAFLTHTSSICRIAPPCGRTPPADKLWRKQRVEVDQADDGLAGEQGFAGGFILPAGQAGEKLKAISHQSPCCKHGSASGGQRAGQSGGVTAAMAERQLGDPRRAGEVCEVVSSVRARSAGTPRHPAVC